MHHDHVMWYSGVILPLSCRDHSLGIPAWLFLVPESKVPSYDVSSEARGQGEVLGAVYGRATALHVSSSTLLLLDM